LEIYINKMQIVPDSINAEIVITIQFYHYVKSIVRLRENHGNNSLKVAMAFSKFLDRSIASI
jgi:hypothetical protein